MSRPSRLSSGRSSPHSKCIVPALEVRHQHRQTRREVRLVVPPSAYRSGIDRLDYLRIARRADELLLVRPLRGREDRFIPGKLEKIEHAPRSRLEVFDELLV